MTERDPLDLLADVADGSEQPHSSFAQRLADQLVAELDNSEIQAGRPDNVIDLREGNDTMELRSPTKRWMWPLLGAAAAIAIVVGVVVASAGDNTDNQTDVVAAQPTVEPTAPPAPAPLVPAPEISLETARALLDAIGGVDGLALAAAVEDQPRNVVTFDPLDNNRALAGDLNFFEPSSPVLWEISDGEVSSRPFNDGPSRSGGAFQRDGTVNQAGNLGNPAVYVSSRSSEVIEDILVGQFEVLYESQGDQAIALITEGVGCPYTRLILGSPEGPSTLDETVGAYARASIVEPGVAVAFPYFQDQASCETGAATVTAAWDLATGEPLPDYQLAGLPIARAAVSGDGNRAVVLDPDGQVSVLSMETGETISTLGTAKAGFTVLPLALNENGTLAAVAEETGTLTLWHVDSGELLLETTADVRNAPVSIKAGVSLAYDATRVALLDSSGDQGVWTFLTLDPNEWLTLACDGGFELSAGERDAQGFDPTVPC